MGGSDQERHHHSEPRQERRNVIKAIEKLEAEAERKVCEHCFSPMLCSFGAY